MSKPATAHAPRPFRNSGEGRYTVCNRWSPDKTIAVPETVHGRTAYLKNGGVRSTIKTVPAHTLKPLAFAEGWDDVTCKACQGRRWWYDAHKINAFEVQA
ncbi:hypothetical protein CcrKarma_gp214 [Caulobacter virus Karma]|uniref:Uncharacterized protein n=5 Tax=Viruses TaxID=10239 RepID=J3SKX3_9CAUD|nr:hypothetical protein D865_gp215 [Caulobacter phage phiCbK]YP_006989594.1 hypothetical protein CcrKarma_gp214 [Caulobacter virus Karma]ARB13738.1 hypothetical protein Ccr10_gp208c [Caulobacter phage Ccr10]ARB14083.1 hypothetical protein Ccr2_gp207c [Caulobacter phage Ccr2]ARB14772.1 hypothetical protein Ccr29_gp216 [Caulobacter phage Ccr29]ARB15116.1 hypothetical protein Ccr32_gp198 [Caulobacter phage Ccr32]ARB15450.1 hypothetical protein Ccr34_gp208 [Caulobacter phage Ccr34]